MHETGKEIPMKKKLTVLISVLLTLALECLPWGVRMRWMAPPPEEIRATWHPYFSMLPFGYGDIFPLATSLMTVFLLLVYLITLKAGEGGCLLNTVSVLASAFSILALGMQIFLLGYLSPIGAGISALLVFTSVLIFRKEKEQPNG